MKTERAQRALAAAVAELERAEAKLSRAFLRWHRSRRKVRRLEKAADEAFREAAAGAGADDDFSDKLPPTGGLGV